MSKITARGRIEADRGLSGPGRSAPRRGKSPISPNSLERMLGWVRRADSASRSDVTPAEEPPQIVQAAIHYHLDESCPELISGWAVHPSGIRSVRVLRDEDPVGAALVGVERPDVHSVFPNMAGSDRAGFRFLPGSHLKEGSNAITLEFEAGDGTLARTTREIVRIDLDGRQARLRYRPGIDRPVRSGLPFEITGLLRAFRPGVYDTDLCWSDDLVARAVDDLKVIWRSGTRTAVLNRYILFLKTMYHRFRCISSRFPRVNERVALDAKDAMSIATSPPEMLAIANQLFVLKSNGLDGHFLEFGCFKGFSSCCLSYCCHQLGLPMEIFDSFAGLPPSEGDGYSAGDFCGTFEEVSSNVEEFGEPRAVHFHKGFFSETLPHFRETPVICIWMDVDLLSSATDVARIFDRLPRSSVVFTHEFPPDGERDGCLVGERSEVFPPIIERFEALGRTPVGRYLYGCLGAIWDAEEGIPVLPHHFLMELVNLAE